MFAQSPGYVERSELDVVKLQVPHPPGTEDIPVSKSRAKKDRDKRV